MHYYVVGINGSGKTSLLKAIAAQTGMEAIQGTTALMEYLGIPGDYNALRAMDQAEVLKKWAQTAESLLDTHPEPFYSTPTY
jgi:predicted ATPase